MLIDERWQALEKGSVIKVKLERYASTLKVVLHVIKASQLSRFQSHEWLTSMYFQYFEGFYQYTQVPQIFQSYEALYCLYFQSKTFSGLQLNKQWVRQIPQYGLYGNVARPRMFLRLGTDDDGYIRGMKNYPVVISLSLKLHVTPTNWTWI